MSVDIKKLAQILGVPRYELETVFDNIAKVSLVTEDFKRFYLRSKLILAEELAAQRADYESRLKVFENAINRKKQTERNFSDLCVRLGIGYGTVKYKTLSESDKKLVQTFIDANMLRITVFGNLVLDEPDAADRIIEHLEIETLNPDKG